MKPRPDPPRPDVPWKSSPEPPPAQAPARTAPAECPCWTCAHFDPRALEQHGQMRCDAFPAGVPVWIQLGQVDHTRPFPGDQGLRYLRGIGHKLVEFP
jgi:hypothetical protein